VDLRRLIEEAGQGAGLAGGRIVVNAQPGLMASVRPKAFKRALANLMMNAAVHGERVEIAAQATPFDGIEIIIDDDGPGIPPDRFEDALAPFGRLDPARNQNKKGVGLGLAIARDVARGHGGDVTLDRSPLGGLRAVVRLPG
jgi:two-component system osmolarity sensor histidine kinase EnvZ